MLQRCAFISPDGDLALAHWAADRPVEVQVEPILNLKDERLRGASGARPLALASPSWSPNGRRLAVSVLYQPGEGQASATLLLIDLNGEEPLLLYPGIPGMPAMIAPGVPHYVNWSPSGDQIALLTQTGAGMTLLLVGIDRRSVPAPLSSGAPLFSSWSADGRALLLHISSDLLLLELDSAPNLETLARNATAFRMPAWAPQGNRFALIRRRGSNVSLNLMDRRGHETALHAFPGRFGACTWSPRGEALVYSVLVSDEPPLYRGLWLDRMDGSEPEKLHDERLVAFFWSPDGRKLGYLTPSLDQHQFNWNVVDVRSHDVSHFTRFYPAPEFRLLVSFFEQYAVSHRLWSPASDALLMNGQIALNGTPPEFTESRLYVQPIEPGRPASSLALGTQASWSPVISG